jgi:nitrile hydratase
MDGIHDLGGKQGYGPIDVGETDEPFHDPWEARLFGITRAYTKPVPFTLDRFRFARETIEPSEYLDRRYYDQWLEAHEVIAIFGGAFTVEEVASGRSAKPIEGLPPPMTPDKVDALSGVMIRYDRPSDARPAFAQGDGVIAKSNGSSGHTRLPQYVRGRGGRVEAFRGFHILPDTNMTGGEAAEALYSVSFLAADLWPEAAGRRDRVYLDLWESYLERA